MSNLIAWILHCIKQRQIYVLYLFIFFIGENEQKIDTVRQISSYVRLVVTIYYYKGMIARTIIIWSGLPLNQCVEVYLFFIAEVFSWTVTAVWSYLGIFFEAWMPYEKKYRFLFHFVCILERIVKRSVSY